MAEPAPPVDYEIEIDLEEEVEDSIEKLKVKALDARDWAATKANGAKSWAQDKAAVARDLMEHERDLVTAAVAASALAGMALGYLIGRVAGDRQTMRAIRAIGRLSESRRRAP